MDCCDAIENPDSVDSLKADFLTVIPSADGEAESLLIRSMKEFCVRSKAWRTQNLLVQISANISSGSMPTVRDAEIIEVEDVHILVENGDDIRLHESRRPVHPEPKPECEPLWYSPNTSQIVFSNPFGETTRLIIECSLVPTSKVISKHILIRYREAILSGALHFAYDLDHKEYKNWRKSAQQKANFEIGISDAAAWWAATATPGRPYHGRAQTRRARRPS